MTSFRPYKIDTEIGSSMDPWPLSSLTFSKFQIRWILEDLVTFHFGGCRDSDCHLCILKSLSLPKKEESNDRDECYVV